MDGTRPSLPARIFRPITAVKAWQADGVMTGIGQTARYPELGMREGGIPVAQPRNGKVASSSSRCHATKAVPGKKSATEKLNPASY
jgi:hypothetical protein